jgi:flagellar hook-associated protein 2
MTDALAGANAGSGATTTSSTGTSATTGTGLGQGINVQQFVQYAVANQQATITNLQTQEATLATQNAELSTIGSDFTTLGNAVQALNDPLGAMGAETVSSSDPGLVGATASSTASPGAHTIAISNLATTASWYTDQVASSSTQLATGDAIAVTVGGKQVASLTTDSSTNTLSAIAQAINNQTSAVHATVVTDANGARLSLVSATSGQSGDIAITGTLHDTTNNNAAVNFNQAIVGKNANLTVDGLPVSSASNTVTGVIPGVTLNLLGPTGANNPISLNVSQDTTQAASAINAFVNAYNAVTTEINNQFNVSSTGSGGGPLENDDSLRQVQSMLLSAISSSTTGNNGIVNLASMGINMNDDGTLTVDNSALSSALASNFSAVQNFFQNATSGFAQQFNNAIQTINGPTTGMMAIDTQSITTTSQQLNQQVTDLQAAMVVQEQQLTNTYSKVNTTLQELPMLENQLSQQLAGIA